MLFLGIDWSVLGQVEVGARIYRQFSKYPVPYSSATNLSTSWATVGFWRRTVLLGVNSDTNDGMYFLWLISEWIQTGCFFYCVQFLGAFAKLRKAIISFVMSVRLHAAVQHPLDGFSWNLIFDYFSNIVEKVEVSLKSDMNNGTLHEDQYTFFFFNRVSLISVTSSQNEKCFRLKL